MPGVIAGVVLRGAVGYGNVELDRQAKEKSIAYLRALSDEIETAVGGRDLATLARENKDELERVLREETSFLTQVRARAEADGDPNLVAVTAGAIADAAHEAATDGIALSAENAEDVARLESDLTEFMADTTEALDRAGTRVAEHTERLDRLDKDYDDLKGSVSAVKVRVEQLGANQDLIVDFMFARMAPGERADALESRRLDRRIACPPDAPDCDIAIIRAALVERYRNEAEVVRTVQSIGSVLTNAGTAVKIAGDLGVDVPPEIGKGLEVANAVFTAATTWATNPLGAISAITGLFGSKTDAAAERHAQLMSFLADNFQNINRQLTQIQENQREIMNGLLGISEQIAEMHQDLDGRLAVLQDSLFVVGTNLQDLIWSEWQGCEDVLQYALSPPGEDEGLIDPSSLVFFSLGERERAVNARGTDVRTCMTAVNRAGAALRSVSGWVRFGTFLDLNRSLLEVNPKEAERLRQATEQDGVEDYREDARRYIEAMVQPSSAILGAWAGRHDIDDLTLLYILAEAPNDMAELETIRARVLDPAPDGGAPWRFTCETKEEGYELIAESTCRSTEAEAMARRYLNVALNTDALPEVARWTLVNSQLADLYRGAGQGFAKDLSDVAAMTGDQFGRDMVETITAIGTMAVAYEQRLHGGITALAIAEDILEGRALEGMHYKILTANPYLAENVVTILMHRWIGRDDLEKGVTGVRFVDRYTQAVVYSRREAEHHPLEILHALFSATEKRPFIMEDGKAAVTITTDRGEVRVPLPGPMQLSEGRFALPPSYTGIIAARNAVLDRLIGYQLAEAEFTSALVAGLQLP